MLEIVCVILLFTLQFQMMGGRGGGVLTKGEIRHLLTIIWGDYYLELESTFDLGRNGWGWKICLVYACSFKHLSLSMPISFMPLKKECRTPFIPKNIAKQTLASYRRKGDQNNRISKYDSGRLARPWSLKESFQPNENCSLILCGFFPHLLTLLLQVL